MFVCGVLISEVKTASFHILALAPGLGKLRYCLKNKHMTFFFSFLHIS